MKKLFSFVPYLWSEISTDAKMVLIMCGFILGYMWATIVYGPMGFVLAIVGTASTVIIILLIHCSIRTCIFVREKWVYWKNMK
jgi:hypothetical protein